MPIPVPPPAKVEHLWRQLLSRPSPEGSLEEARLGAWLLERLGGLPYFSSRPACLQRIPVEGNPERCALVAWVQGGQPGPAAVLVARYGTPTAGRYGPLPPEEASRRRDSGEWVAGWGAAAKAGAAAVLALIEAWAEHPGALPGHAVACLVPGAPDSPEPVRTLAPALTRLVRSAGLQVAAVLAAEPCSPLYPGDPYRYLYLGAAGWVDLAFYLRGAGPQAAEETAFLAASLLRRLSWAPDLADAGALPALPGWDLPEQEPAFPPLPRAVPGAELLGPGEAAAGFRWYTHTRSPAELACTACAAAQAALRDALHLLRARRHRWRELAGWPPPDPPPVPRVVPLGRLGESPSPEPVREAPAGPAQKPPQGPESRAADLLEAARRAASRWPSGEPLAVLFAFRWSPRAEPDTSSAAGARLQEAVRAVLREASQAFPGHPIAVRRYAPWGSCLGVLGKSPDRGQEPGLTALMPFEAPAVAPASGGLAGTPGAVLGAYGEHLHTPAERAHREYACTVLPWLAAALVERLLGWP